MIASYLPGENLRFVFHMFSPKKRAAHELAPLPSCSLKDYRFASDNINKISRYVTDLILFSISPNADGSLGSCCLYRSHFSMAKTAKRQKKRYLSEHSASPFLGYGGRCKVMSCMDRLHFL